MQRTFTAGPWAALAIALAVFAGVAWAAQADVALSQVSFLAKQSEVALEGRFAQFAADIDFDPAHPQAGHVKVSIDLSSVDAGGADANNLLKSKEFFDVAGAPNATFVSTAVSARGASGFQAAGTFTLKGHSVNLVIPFVARSDATGLWVEGGAPISRLAFKVGEGQWGDTSLLDDDVQIRFKVHIAR